MAKPGDLLRLRNFRHYMDHRSWVEYRCGPKEEKTKHVFVALVLGCEPLILTDELEKNYKKRVAEALLELGYMPVDDALEAGADPKKFKFKFELVDLHSKPEKKKSKRASKKGQKTP